MHSVSTLISILALASSALSSQYTINNHCSYAVTRSEWGPDPGEQGTIAAGASYSSQIKSRANGGYSVKLSKDGSTSDVTQFEYTYDASQNALSYDISFINGGPFKSDGIKVTPTSSVGSDNCVVVDCTNGCANTVAYYAPTDNAASKTCPLATDMQVDLCGGAKKRDLEFRDHSRAFRYTRATLA